MARYPLGQPIRLSFTVRDTTGALVNPGTATLVVKVAAADGTSTTTGTYSSLTNDGTGLLHQDIPVTDLVAAGHYQYALTTTGTGAGVSFGEFDVFDPFETSVLPLADGKDHLNIDQAVTKYDGEIAAFIATIESALERFTGGPLVNRQVTERAEMLSNQTVILVRQRPLVSVVSVTSASGGAIDISGGLDIDTNAGTVRRKLGLPFYGPFFQWLPQVNIVYVAGWGTSVQPAFSSAARIILAHLWESQRGPASLPGLGGGDMVTMPGFGFAIPNMAAELLDGAANGIPYANEAFV